MYDFFFLIKDRAVASPMLLVTGSAFLQKAGHAFLVSGPGSVLLSLIFSSGDWLFTASNLSGTQRPIFEDIIASERVFQTSFNTLLYF